MQRTSERSLFVLAVVVAVVIAVACIGMFAGITSEKRVVRKAALTALSTDPARVTGGDVLLQIALPPGIPAQRVKVTVGPRDVSGAFRAGTAPDTLVGLVTGLANGRSIVRVDTGAGETADASMEVTNYPITGPVISGPWQQPFICQTDVFVLPDGTKLGSPLDANCSARTVVQYVYWMTGTPGSFKSLPSLTSLPADVAKTTIVTGATVNFVVRVETGTMDRGIYQNAILHDPTSEPPPTPFAPPKGWNRRLYALHGAGCPTGWYVQGGAEGVNLLDADRAARLGQGYALFINTLNHPTNSCNAFLAGEATMMGKEHFIETFGVPFYTISTGGSGGAYTSLQIADAFPGLIDGISISSTFPDALAIALSGLDGHLLAHYFAAGEGAAYTDAQQVAISGYSGVKAFLDAANQSQRTDPVPNRVDIAGYQSARWNAAVPETLRYDPVKNPKGARPTVFDAARNIYGVSPTTGAALRPFDNVGVQYGLGALNGGAITPAQFVTLNEKIGGVDQDGNYVPSRTAGDTGAIRRAYQGGLSLGGSGGLSSIPVFDNATTNEAGGYHYAWFHFAVRERIRQANGGNSDNMVIWRNTTPAAITPVFDAWMVAYKSDTSADPQRVKVIRARPTEAADGCYDTATPPVFLAEKVVFSSKPVSKCSALFPVYSNARKEAGGPLAANVLKCQLKPVDPRDYTVPLSASELSRLKAIFPGGVCDWSKSGVSQVPVVAWASFGPSPKNLVFDVTRP